MARNNFVQHTLYEVIRRKHDEAQKSLNETLKQAPYSRTVEDLQNLQDKESQLNQVLEERAKLMARLNEIDAAGQRGEGTPQMLSEAMDINDELKKMDKQLREMGYDGIEEATEKQKELNKAVSDSVPASYNFV